MREKERDREGERECKKKQEAGEIQTRDLVRAREFQSTEEDVIINTYGKRQSGGQELTREESTHSTHELADFISPKDSKLCRIIGIINKKSGYLLDVSKESTSNGANVLQWENNGGSNQMWKVTAH